MYIRPIRFLEDSASSTKFDSDRRLYPGFTSLDKNDSGKIVEAIAADENNKDEEEDL